MRKRQGLLLIMDGLGDRPHPLLKGKTPLEDATTPNLDKLAASGMCGNVYPISPGIPVGTDVGHLHIFGYDSAKFYRGRGPLEAASGGIDVRPGDVAFRGNFGTMDEHGIVTDRRAGRIRAGTEKLAEALDGLRLSDGTAVLARALTEHRVAIVLRNHSLSDQITGTDPGTAREGNPLASPAPLDDTPEAQRTAKALQEFTTRSYELLRHHPVNQTRTKQGLPPANIVITRGAGMKTEIPSMTKRYGLKAACIAGDQTVGGIAKQVGMDYYSDPAFTGSFRTDYTGKARLALRLLADGYHWVVVHIKGSDLAGHDNLPEEKRAIIERVDAMTGLLLGALDLSEYVGVVGHPVSVWLDSGVGLTRQLRRQDWTLTS
jgi:2,3-bisphosphoglycerate-independent phosphoglycerate mutase